MTKAVFLEDEVGWRCALLGHTELLQPLWVSPSLSFPLLLGQMPVLPQKDTWKEHLLTASAQCPFLGSHCRSLPSGHPELYLVNGFIFIPIPF